MNLMYLDQKAIDDIKLNCRKYKTHFLDEKNTWFIEYFKKNGWLHDSKIQCSDIKMNMDKDYNISDRKNVEILYEALFDLSPSLAIDERLWAGMLFGPFWEYVQYRRADKLRSGDEREFLNSFFFMRGTKRSCFINCLSRLWWTGYLLYDKSAENHYEAVDLVTESAFASNIILFSSNNFTSNKEVALGVLDCIRKRKEAGEKIGRYHFVEANKYLNCLGGVYLLDTLKRREVRDLVNASLNKCYGTISMEIQEKKLEEAS